jgi:hypothetical protein
MVLEPAAGGVYRFDAQGRLFTDTGTASTGLTLTVSGDGVTRTVSVAQETGYVF